MTNSFARGRGGEGSTDEVRDTRSDRRSAFSLSGHQLDHTTNGGSFLSQPGVIAKHFPRPQLPYRDGIEQGCVVVVGGAA